ncbi:MAG: hypothetical protein JEY97_10785 [Bacteroidales bacterium]|nr:hypothetical protein [Bacteroidales bacterium]
MPKRNKQLNTQIAKILILILGVTLSSNVFSVKESSYDRVENNKRPVSTDETGCEYIIISPNADYFVQWANEIKNFRNKQGIISDVFTLEEIGGSSVNEIEIFLDNAYTAWDITPIGILLLGDYGTNPENSIISPIYQSYCVADNMFADVDGDDLPEMVISRICATNQIELEIMINKFIDYETSPPQAQSFYQNPITSVAWSTPSTNQVFIEVVGGFWKNILNKEPERINEIMSGDPNVDPWTTAQGYEPIIEYFGPNGLGYIPETPAELGGWTGGTASLINNAINQGAFMLMHKSSGSIYGWSMPSYTNSDINGLTNENPVFVFSTDALTGKFNSSIECFAEKFHRYSYNGLNSGALSVIAPSEITYSFLNDTYGWGVIDFLWDDFLPESSSFLQTNYKYTAFANVAGKYALAQSPFPYNPENKKVTYNLFHHFGDVFSVIYTEMPQALSVFHSSTIQEGIDNISVSANEGAFICFSVNGEIIGRGEVQNSPEIIQIIPQLAGTQIDVVATKSNFFRHESSINVTGGGNSQDIQLTSGYQFASSRIEPVNSDMLIVLQDILNDNLDFVRNSNGETLRKIGPNWVNGIGDWISTEGYLFKMNANDSFQVDGNTLDPLSPISLIVGYQFLSYLPDISIDAIIAFESILNDNLEFIRNSNGEVLRKIGPNWVNGIGNANPGEAYLIKMLEDDVLVYTIPE